MDILTRNRSHRVRLISILAVCFLTSLACSRSGQSAASIWSISEYQPSPTPDSNNPISNPLPQFILPAGAFVPTRAPGAPIQTPTPDAPHPLPAMRTEARQHTVKAGETLGTIAKQYGVGVQQLVEVNELANPDFLQAGWTLQIPAPTPAVHGLAFKIIPDSELIYSPGTANFNTTGFIQSKAGYLAGYSGDAEGKTQTGAQIVELVAREYSVNPRLLLAVLEYQSGWVTKPNPGLQYYRLSYRRNRSAAEGIIQPAIVCG